MLTDEHVLPFSLGGHRVLPKSSCHMCNEETKRIEGVVARQMLGVVRAQLGVQTKRPSERRYDTEIEFRTDQESRSLTVAVWEVPLLILLPRYDRPGILVGRPPKDGIGLTEAVLCGRGSIDILQKRLGSGTIIQDAQMAPQIFARVLAKIAHGLTVANYEDDLEYFLPDVILGKSQAIGHYVGNEGNIALDHPKPRPLHGTGFVRRGDLLMAIIRLFGFHDLSPTYTVVTGRFRT